MAAPGRREVPAPAPPATTRLPRAERERQIVEAAAALFAEQGFAATTRELAQRLGVTQALLYRYFPSKQALLERVFEQVVGGLRGRARPALLAGRQLPLEARLRAFYLDYMATASPTGTRLFVRASLEGLELARRYGGPLTERVLGPIVLELRHEAGLPGFAERPMLRGERELAMALHGGLMFIRIRQHVYGMPMPDTLDDLVGLQIRTYLPGALAELRRLHAAPENDAMTVRQLGRGT